MITDELTAVRNWLHRDGQVPSDEAIAVAVAEAVHEWKAQRASGLDVMASAALDELAEIVQAMRVLT